MTLQAVLIVGAVAFLIGCTIAALRPDALVRVIGATAVVGVALNLYVRLAAR